MMKTTVQSATNKDTFLEVSSIPGVGVQVLVRNGDYTLGAAVGTDDVPRLALAELHAAGFDGAGDSHADAAVAPLREHNKAQVAAAAVAAAAARERAELEAEALELINIVRQAQGHSLYQKFTDISVGLREGWLAAARHARKMNGRAGQ